MSGGNAAAQQPIPLDQPCFDCGIPFRDHDDRATIRDLRAALDTPAPLDVERLARAMDAADPPVDGDGYEEEDHAEHLAYAKEIAAEYARLRENVPEGSRP